MEHIHDCVLRPAFSSVWCRSIRNSYDLLLVPSNWPQARGYAFEHLLIARAIENQAAVVGANRAAARTNMGNTTACRIFSTQR